MSDSVKPKKVTNVSKVFAEQKSLKTRSSITCENVPLTEY